MEADVLVAHLSLDFGLWGKSCHGVDNEHVDGTGVDELLGDVESLFSVVGLREPEVVDIHAKFLGVETVEGVLGIDYGADTALLLGFGDDVDGEGCLTGRLGTVDLGDTATGETAYAEGVVESERAGGDGLDVLDGVVAEAHDCTGAEVLFEVSHCHVESLELRVFI